MWKHVFVNFVLKWKVLKNIKNKGGSCGVHTHFKSILVFFDTDIPIFKFYREIWF